MSLSIKRGACWGQHLPQDVLTQRMVPAPDNEGSEHCTPHRLNADSHRALPKIANSPAYITPAGT